MHSRIFQVDTKPISDYDYIEEDNYFDHWFLNQIADYVSDDYDRDASIEWLAECANGCEIDHDNNGYYLVVCDKEAYFKNKYDMFVGALNKLGIPTIDQFVNGIDMWQFESAYDDKFGFYIDSSDFGLITLDEFIRRSNELDKYYIGGVVDYHF